IRPRAAAILAEPVVPQDQLKPGQIITHNLRSPFVILKDYEQEVALILATWALSLIGYQALAVARDRRLLEKPYVEIPEGRVVLPDDARAYGRPIESLPREEQEMLLPRALMVALNRFGATLTALVSCIVVMFCLHQLQQAQDRFVLDARMYIDRRLIRNMRVSSSRARRLHSSR